MATPKRTAATMSRHRASSGPGVAPRAPALHHRVVMSPRLLVDPPAWTPLLLRPALALARRQTGKDPLPGRLLAHFPKGAFGAGMLELCAADASDLESDDGARLLAIARITASAVAGCPFCVDMNAATWQRAGLTRDELVALLARDDAALAALALEPRAALTARYAAALSATPVSVADDLATALRQHFSERQLVVLATTIAQVNFWARFNQGMGIPAAGFFDDSVCKLPGS